MIKMLTSIFEKKYWILSICICFIILFNPKDFVAQALNSQPLPITDKIITNKAIKVGFETHIPGVKYNKFAQSKDWDAISSKESWMKHAVITDQEAHSGEKSLRITYPADMRSGGSAVWNLPSRPEYYLSYWVKFDQDFDFNGSRKSGGKLPGLGARDAAEDLCSGGKTCNGENGFSSRYMWRRNGRATLYLYHMNKPGRWGETFNLRKSNGKIQYFQKGKWHHLTQRVKINDGNQSNGEVDVWMDGKQVLSLDKLKFVTNNQQIDSLYFSTFHGGQTREWLPQRKVYSYWDDFIISTNKADVGL